MSVDGSILEGGGQVLRNCTAYACLLGKSLRIHDIRGKRTKPGLQNQHLTGLKLVAEMCKATTSGIEKNSTEISFEPNEIVPGNYVAEIQTAGACTLMAQISLPLALYSSGKTTLVLKGGTDVPMSPLAGYLQHVFLPTLKNMGVNGVQANIQKHGFMPFGSGSMELEIEPISKISSIVLMERGAVVNYVAYFSGYCTRKFADEVRSHFSMLKDTDVQIKYDIVETTSDKGQVSLLLTAHTEGSCIFGVSVLGDKNSTGQRMVEAAIRKMKELLLDEICVDEYLQDQLILFMALADGISKIKCGKITLHTETAIHFAQEMTGATFESARLGEVGVVEKEINIMTCTGIGLKNINSL